MKKVIIVHAIDTEGPLHETIETKFDRINEIIGKINLKPTKKNFKKLLKGEIKISKNKKDKISQIFSSHLNSYNEDWEQIDRMLSNLMSKNLEKNILIKWEIVGNLPGTVRSSKF